MHVAFALLTLQPGEMGGSESNVKGLLGQYADGSGPERVSVLATPRVHAAYERFERGPVELVSVPTYRPGNAPAARLAAMAAAAAAPGRIARGVPVRPDVVHYPVTVPIPRLPGVPTVLSLYDVQHHELPELFSRAERIYRSRAYDAAARGADLVVTTSEYSRERLIEYIGVAPDRVESVLMGIDHDRFHTEATEEDERVLAAVSVPERFVIYPANLWPHKNHRRLVDALAQVEDPDLVLLLTGQDYGRAEELLAHAREAGVGDRVRHLGYLPAPALPALLRRATAMIFPSLYEGFGSPPLEAMACGCPVASSDRGSLAETAGDAVVALDPESPESIAAAIETVTGDQALRATLRERGLRRASEFRWEAAAQRHRELYERVAA